MGLIKPLQLPYCFKSFLDCFLWVLPHNARPLDCRISKHLQTFKKRLKRFPLFYRLLLNQFLMLLKYFDQIAAFEIQILEHDLQTSRENSCFVFSNLLFIRLISFYYLLFHTFDQSFNLYQVFGDISLEVGNYLTLVLEVRVIVIKLLLD